MRCPFFGPQRGHTPEGIFKGERQRLGEGQVAGPWQVLAVVLQQKLLPFDPGLGRSGVVEGV